MIKRGPFCCRTSLTLPLTLLRILEDVPQVILQVVFLVAVPERLLITQCSLSISVLSFMFSVFAKRNLRDAIAGRDGPGSDPYAAYRMGPGEDPAIEMTGSQEALGVSEPEGAVDHVGLTVTGFDGISKEPAATNIDDDDGLVVADDVVVDEGEKGDEGDEGDEGEGAVGEEDMAAVSPRAAGADISSTHEDDAIPDGSLDKSNSAIQATVAVQDQTAMLGGDDSDEEDIG